jgi:hypothetical protein
MKLLQEGKLESKVPWISGVNSEEGLILSSGEFPIITTTLSS